MGTEHVLKSSLRRLKERLLNSSFLRAASGTFALKITATLLGIVTSFVLARILEPEGYGSYTYTLAWINLLFIPAMMGFDRLLVREVAISHSKSRWSHLKGLLKWTNIISITLSLTIVSIMLLAFRYFGGSPESGKIALLLLALPLLPILTLTTLRKAAMQGLHRVVLGQLPESLFRPVFLISIVAIVYLMNRDDFNTNTAILSNVAAAFLAFLLGARLLMKSLPPQLREVNPEAFQPLWIRSAIPLMLVGVMQSINNQISILMLGHFHSIEQVGLFSIARQVSTLGTFFIMSFNSVLAPRFAHLYAEGKIKELQQIVAKSSLALAILSATVSILFILYGTDILTLFGPGYDRGYVSLAILAVGVFFNSAMGPVGLLLTMTSHENVAVKGLGMALIANLLFSFMLIPKMGAEGAALSMSLYLFVWNTIFAIYVYKNIRIIPSFFSYFWKPASSSP